MFFLIVLAVPAVVSGAGENSLPEEYQAIIDRKPFGEEPENFDPTLPPQQAKEQQRAASAVQNRSQEEQRIASAVRVSVLNVTPRGDIFVGFTDSSANPPVNYFMRVGETNTGWTVVSADPASQAVILSKNGMDVALSLGAGTSGNMQQSGRDNRNSFKNKAAGHAPMQLNHIAPNTLATKTYDGVPAAAGAGSYRERLRARHLKQQADSAAQKAEMEKQKARADEEKQRAAEERAAMRDQLAAIQETLSAARAERAALEAKKKEEQQNQPLAEEPVE